MKHIKQFEIDQLNQIPDSEAQPITEGKHIHTHDHAFEPILSPLSLPRRQKQAKMSTEPLHEAFVMVSMPATQSE